MKSLMPLPKVLNRSVAHMTAVCRVATQGQTLNTVAKPARRNLQNHVPLATLCVNIDCSHLTLHSELRSDLKHLRSEAHAHQIKHRQTESTAGCGANAPAPSRYTCLQLRLAEVPVVPCQPSHEEQAAAGGNPIFGACQGQSLLQQRQARLLQ